MTDKKLTINWVLPRPSLAGGVKSNRLIAEAMVRRGHRGQYCLMLTCRLRASNLESSDTDPLLARIE